MRVPHEMICRDPATIAVVTSAVISSTGSVISSRNERKGAERAASAQQEIADKQLQAVKDSETDAQTTANTQRKAALARRSKTILSSPLGATVDPEQVNKPSILGVPS